MPRSKLFAFKSTIVHLHKREEFVSHQQLIPRLVFDYVEQTVSHRRLLINKAMKSFDTDGHLSRQRKRWRSQPIVQSIEVARPGLVPELLSPFERSAKLVTKFFKRPVFNFDEKVAYPPKSVFRFIKDFFSPKKIYGPIRQELPVRFIVVCRHLSVRLVPVLRRPRLHH